jgi:hypothetical protein
MERTGKLASLANQIQAIEETQQGKLAGGFSALGSAIGNASLKNAGTNNGCTNTNTNNATSCSCSCNASIN